MALSRSAVSELLEAFRAAEGVNLTASRIAPHTGAGTHSQGLTTVSSINSAA